MPVRYLSRRRLLTWCARSRAMIAPANGACVETGRARPHVHSRVHSSRPPLSSVTPPARSRSPKSAHPCLRVETHHQPPGTGKIVSNSMTRARAKCARLRGLEPLKPPWIDWGSISCFEIRDQQSAALSTAPRVLHPWPSIRFCRATPPVGARVVNCAPRVICAGGAQQRASRPRIIIQPHCLEPAHAGRPSTKQMFGPARPRYPRITLKSRQGAKTGTIRRHPASPRPHRSRFSH